MSKKIIIPSDISELDFWLSVRSPGESVVDLFILTSQGSLTIPLTYFVSRWHMELEEIEDLFALPFIQKHFSFKKDKDFLNISRKNRSSTTANREEMVDDLAGRVLIHFNESFGTRYRNAAAWIGGLEFWAKYYSEDDIMEAIDRARTDDFWTDKMTPVILFRRKNPQGQDVDYIGGLINKKTRNRSVNVSDRMMG